MKPGSIVAIYALFWAMSFFLVLPFRLQMRGGDDVAVPGQAESAPPRFSLARTSLWTTFVACALFGLFYGNYVYGWVSVPTVDAAAGGTSPDDR